MGTDLIWSKSGGHPRVLLQRAPGIVVGVRVPLLRVTSARGGRSRGMMVVRMVVEVVVVEERGDRQRVFAAGGRGHGRRGRGRRAHGRCGGQQLLVTADRLVVTRRSRGQRWQRWRGRAPLDAGHRRCRCRRRRRRRRHYRRGTTSSARSRFGDRRWSVVVVVVAATGAAAAAVVVPRTVAVPAHLSEKRFVNSNY